MSQLLVAIFPVRAKKEKNVYNDSEETATLHAEKDHCFSSEQQDLVCKDHENADKCLCRPRVVKYFLCVSTLILIANLITVLYLIYSVYSASGENKKTDAYHSIEDDSSVYLPCINSSTESLENSDYCKHENRKAERNLLTIILSEFVGRRNFTVDPPEKDKNRPILKQKFSEMYYVDKSNKTDGELELHTPKPSRQNAIDRQTKLVVPMSATFVLYASTQFCFRPSRNISGVVSVQILKQSGVDKAVLYHRSVPYRTGFLSFEPNNCLLPVRLKQDDRLSIRITAAPSFYEMRVANVFGVREISSE